MIFSSKNCPPGYYVYLYLREDGTPYYVGKGKSNRAWHSQHTVSPPTDESKVVIVSYDLNELWAFVMERRLIRWYRRKNVIYHDLDGSKIEPLLRNMTDGGEGAAGYVFTDQDRQKQRDGQKRSKNKKIESLKKYYQTVDKTSDEYLNRIEKMRKYQKEDKVWTEKALQNLKDIAKISADRRRGTEWSEVHRLARERNYVAKNIDTAMKVYVLEDLGLNKRQISLDLNITWDKVNYAIKNKDMFTSYLPSNQAS